MNASRVGSNALHDGEAPELVRKITSRGTQNTLLFGNATLHEPKYHRRTRPGSEESDTGINQSVRGRIHPDKESS